MLGAFSSICGNEIKIDGGLGLRWDAFLVIWAKSQSPFPQFRDIYFPAFL